MILGLINNIRAYKLGNPSPLLEILRKRPFIVKILCSSFFVSSVCTLLLNQIYLKANIMRRFIFIRHVYCIFKLVLRHII